MTRNIKSDTTTWKRDLDALLRFLWEPPRIMLQNTNFRVKPFGQNRLRHTQGHFQDVDKNDSKVTRTKKASFELNQRDHATR